MKTFFLREGAKKMEEKKKKNQSKTVYLQHMYLTNNLYLEYTNTSKLTIKRRSSLFKMHISRIDDIQPLTKSQHLFMLKTFHKLGIEDNFLNQIRGI